VSDDVHNQSYSLREQRNRFAIEVPFMSFVAEKELLKGGV
jgi:hypothetical protein